MTLNSFFNKYTFFLLSQLPNWLVLPSNLQYRDKIVKSRSFGVEDLRIEDRLWQRARGTRRQTDLLWIRLSDSVTNLSGCLTWFFTLVCANIWLPYSLDKYFHCASWPSVRCLCVINELQLVLYSELPHTHLRVISLFCSNMKKFLNHLFFGYVKCHWSKA